MWRSHETLEPLLRLVNRLKEFPRANEYDRVFEVVLDEPLSLLLSFPAFNVTFGRVISLLKHLPI